MENRTYFFVSKARLGIFFEIFSLSCTFLKILYWEWNRIHFRTQFFHCQSNFFYKKTLFISGLIRRISVMLKDWNYQPQTKIQVIYIDFTKKKKCYLLTFFYQLFVYLSVMLLNELKPGLKYETGECGGDSPATKRFVISG